MRYVFRSSPKKTTNHTPLTYHLYTDNHKNKPSGIILHPRHHHSICNVRLTPTNGIAVTTTATSLPPLTICTAHLTPDDDCTVLRDELGALSKLIPSDHRVLLAIDANAHLPPRLPHVGIRLPLAKRATHNANISSSGSSTATCRQEPPCPAAASTPYAHHATPTGPSDTLTPQLTDGLATLSLH